MRVGIQYICDGVRCFIFQTDPQKLVPSLLKGDFVNGCAPFQPFKPVVDGAFHADKSGAFLPDEPWTMLAAGKAADVPVLMGSNRDDGAIAASEFVLDETALFAELADNWEEEFPALVFTRLDMNCLIRPRRP